MAAAAPGADFKLVLHGVGAEARSAIIAELMAVFQIDQATAASATENVPIVLVGGMTQPQALCLRTHIVRLVKLGADLKLTSEQVGKVKQLRWQAPPAATRAAANLFTCPSCGERFVVQRWQPPAAAPAAPVPAAAPAPGAAPLEAEPLEAEPLEAEPVEEALPAEELDFAEELAALPAEEPAAEVPAEVAEAEAIAEPEPLEAEAIDEEEDLLGAFAEEAEGPEPEPVAPEPPPEPAQPPPPSVPKPTVPRPAPAAPSQPKPIAVQPQGPPSPPRPAAAPKLPPQPVPPPKPVAAPKPAAAPKPPAPASPSAQPEPEAPAGPRYDVSVAKVRGDKLDRLAELVAQRQGITFEEALGSCEKTVVVVCRGGTSAEADECRKALLAIGIKPRIRKRGG